MDELIKELDKQPWYTKSLISIGLIVTLYLLDFLDEKDVEDESIDNAHSN